MKKFISSQISGVNKKQKNKNLLEFYFDESK